MLIRQEKQTDFAAVYQLVKTAFAGAEHADGNEQDLVDALRKSEAFIPALSLVAEIAGEIAGYILFTKARAGGEPVLVLAPLAVLPGYRKRGVGGALIREGHRIAAMLGYGYSLVLGSVNYYQRFGYVPAGNPGRQLHGRQTDKGRARRLWNRALCKGVRDIGIVRSSAKPRPRIFTPGAASRLRQIRIWEHRSAMVAHVRLREHFQHKKTSQMFFPEPGLGAMLRARFRKEHPLPDERPRLHAHDRCSAHIFRSTCVSGVPPFPPIFRAHAPCGT